MASHRTLQPPTDLWRSAWRTATNLLMPPRCVLCETDLDDTATRQVCVRCEGELTNDLHPACRRCGVRVPSGGMADCAHCRPRRFRFDRTFRLGDYDGTLRDAILRAKTIAGEPVAAALGGMLAGAVLADLNDGFDNSAPFEQFDLVTCVPAYWWRRLRRGTNSAAVIAQVLARELDLPTGLDLLVCRRNIEKQSSLSLDQRRRNVRAAFRTSWGYDVADARILLVDDVMTTGATAHEISKVLRRAGAASVAVAVAGRATGGGLVGYRGQGTGAGGQGPVPNDQMTSLMVACRRAGNRNNR